MNYQKNYLASVVCRLEFTSRPAALVPLDRTPFTGLIAERFPVVVEAAKVGFSVQVVPGAPGSGLEQSLISKAWHHRKTNEGKLVAVLDPEFLSLECVGEFTNFDDFKAELSFLVDKLRSAFPDVTFSRIGLRYINEINLDEGSPLDWDGLISPKLVDSVFAAIQEKPKLTRSIHQVVTNNDGITLVFTYGIHNPDFPNPVARRIFILDIDSQKAGLTTYEEVGLAVTQMNLQCESIFERSIENGLRQKMGVING